MSTTISEQEYFLAASKLRCEPASVKAVDSVESGGAGMVNERPVILFEPHVFWKRLKAHGEDPEKILAKNPDLADMLYPKWGAKPYPKGQDAQHERLARAVLVHREAALESCSWGRYQIMGFNWKLCGCASIQGFINEIYKGDARHLHLFVAYIIKVGLDDELRGRDWDGFALGYNGPLYRKNNYATKLSLAYNQFLHLAN